MGQLATKQCQRQRGEERRVLLRTMRIIMSGGGGVAKTSKAIRSLSRKQEIRQSSSEPLIIHTLSHKISQYQVLALKYFQQRAFCVSQPSGFDSLLFMSYIKIT